MKKSLIFLILSMFLMGCWESDESKSYSDPPTVEASENMADTDDDSEVSHSEDSPFDNPENDENDGDENLRPE